MRTHINPRLLARGSIHLTQGAAGYIAGSLYNNSTGAHLLMVLDAEGDSNVNGYNGSIRVAKGALGTAGGAVDPLVSGDAAPPGTLYHAEYASEPVATFSFGCGISYAPQWNHDYPLAILQPGWSLEYFSTNTAQTTLRVGFIWQVITPEDLDRLSTLFFAEVKPA